VDYQGEDFGIGAGFAKDGDGNWGLTGGFANDHLNIGAGVDSAGHYDVAAAYHDQNFGIGTRFGNANLLGPYDDYYGGYDMGCGGFYNMGGVIDFETILLMIMAVMEQDSRDEIADTIRKMKKASDKMKSVTKEDATERPGTIPGMNVDTSILQAQLTMAIQKRQQFIDMINNAIKSAHDSKMNTVRRMV
jgi:hypothetical protein